MKVTTDTGMLTLKSHKHGLQLYWPIMSFREKVLKLSFLTVLVVGGKTWQLDWSAGFQVLGFGFGICKYKT